MNLNTTNSLNTFPLKYLIFCVGKEHFAIPLRSVLEVIELKEFTPLPESQTSHIDGVIQVRGKILSVLDLRKKLHCTPPYHSKPCVISVSLESKEFGFIVDKILEVHSFKKEEIQQNSSSQEHTFEKSRYILGFGKKENQTQICIFLALNEFLKT